MLITWIALTQISIITAIILFLLQSIINVNKGLFRSVILIMYGIFYFTIMRHIPLMPLQRKNLTEKIFPLKEGQGGVILQN